MVIVPSPHKIVPKRMTESRLFSLILLLSLFRTGIAHSQSEETVIGELEVIEDSVATLAEKGDGFLTGDELLARLESVGSCVDLRVTDVVRGYIRNYVNRNSEKASMMLGRRLTYFPLYEEKMREYGVPEDLKYLSVVESALNAKAVSRVGATGLWQFMPSTGGEYGLHTNSAVEDRSNPVKSTDAAARHLRDLYKMFDDWALALAAYNSGAGRVNSAIKRAGSRDFWQIQKFLPLETRNYVPAFIAATYLCNFYYLHGVSSSDPDLDLQLTGYINVYEGISFQDIADATGVSAELVKELNPGFKRDYVPPTTDGNYVVIPKRVMPAFVRYLNSISSARSYKLDKPEEYTSRDLGDGRYWESRVTMRESLSVKEYARRAGLCAEHVKAWNNLTGDFLNLGQKIVLHRPVYVQKHSAVRIDMPVSQEEKPSRSTGKPQPSGNTTAENQPAPQPAEAPRWLYHVVRRNESLEDIARLYSTSTEGIRRLNDCSKVKFGDRLKIRSL